MEEKLRKIDDIDVFPKMVGDKQAKDKMLKELSEWAKEGVETAERKACERKERDEKRRRKRKLIVKIVVTATIGAAVTTIFSTGYAISRGINSLTKSGQKDLNSKGYHFYQDPDGAYFADERAGIDPFTNEFMYSLVTDSDLKKCQEVLKDDGYTISESALIIGDTFGWDKAIFNLEEKPYVLDVMKTAIERGFDDINQKVSSFGRGSK